LDHAYLKKSPPPFGRIGLLTRVDIPFIITHDANDGKRLGALIPFLPGGDTEGTSAGLGDIYGQALIAPYRKGRFVLPLGSGVYVPTATNKRLGTGKLTIAPLAVPFWYNERGFFTIKVQDFFSVAGVKDRANVHYMLVTPILLRTLKGPYWVQLDAETLTNWKASGHTGAKVGFLFGKMHLKLGVWVKVEVGIGTYRAQSIAIKTSLFRVR
jgi:hypothetical protein